MSKNSIYPKQENSKFFPSKHLDICSDEGQGRLEEAYLKSIREIEVRINQIMQDLKKSDNPTAVELEQQRHALNAKKLALQGGYEKLMALHDTQEDFEKNWILSK